MAALDTFDWFTSSGLKNLDEEIQLFIKTQRAYLLTLRNEDERQRFVEGVIQELRYRLLQKQSGRRTT